MSLFKKERIESLKKSAPTKKHDHTILIVDDEANNLHVLKTVLEDQYEVLTANSGFEALEVIQQTAEPDQISLIISDQRMPGMSGVELLEKTITLIPNCIRIILTGYTDVEDAIDAINRGRIYQYVIKPFERRELLLTVQRAIEAYKREQQVRHLALHDPLTGLPNRSLFQDRLKQYAAMAKRHEASMAVMVMDLNNFKSINDTFGHSAGDQLLIQIGERLTETLRESDTVSRLGGDEFALITPNVSGREIDLVVQRIISVFKESYKVDNSQFEVSPSIGVVLYPDNCDDASMLVQQADIAMYAAKGSNEDYAIYTSEQGKSNEMRLRLVHDLKKAIEQQSFNLLYQPILDLKSDTITHVEAYVRWNHEEFGVIEPEQLIPLAEYTGRLNYLTEWIVDKAVSQLSKWQSAGMLLSMSINLSDMDLLNRKLAETVQEKIEKYEISAESLLLEFSETGLARSPKHVTEALNKLSALGLNISLDDFGTGLSSILQLRKLPIAELKIDQSFTQTLLEDEDSAVIVRSAIALGHNLGLTVTAEGVETADCRDTLKDYGCDCVQGFHLAKPMSGNDLNEWFKLTNHKVRT